MFDSQTLLVRAMMLVPMVLSLTVHEFAHAWSAWLLGDDTAERQGRLTLNPLPHIDPLGTLLLPLLGIPFGWARPVPVNPVRFSRRVTMRTGMLLTAAAGPLSNLVLAVLSTVVYGGLFRFAPQVLETQPALQLLLVAMIQVNVGLAVFNMLPVPPLDGSRVVDGLMPLRWRPAWEAVTRLGPFLLLIVLFAGGTLTSGPRLFITSLLQRLLTAIAA